MTTSSDNDIRKRRGVLAFKCASWLVLGFVAFAMVYLAFTSGVLQKDVITLAFLLILSILPISVTTMIHEGLHVIAAHWLDVPREQIGAKGNQAFTGKVPKSIWVKVTLAPLLFPLFVFVLLAALEWRLAIVVAIVIAIGSVNDLAYLTIALQQPGKFVSDTEAGIYVMD